jgi:hypothetical protein
VYNNKTSLNFVTGQPLNQWKNYLNQVITTINMHNERKYKSFNQLLTDYFTRSTVLLPQDHNTFYKFNVNDTVAIDVTPSQRKMLGFKYSLNRGIVKTKAY